MHFNHRDRCVMYLILFITLLAKFDQNWASSLKDMTHPKKAQKNMKSKNIHKKPIKKLISSTLNEILFCNCLYLYR